MREVDLEEKVAGRFIITFLFTFFSVWELFEMLLTLNAKAGIPVTLAKVHENVTKKKTYQVKYIKLSENT